jgi:hypothetical protein
LDADTNTTKRMTPQEKAKELVDKFSVVGLQQRNEGIACASIAVDEMLKVAFFISDNEIYNYLLEVKQEIEKL